MPKSITNYKIIFEKNSCCLNFLNFYKKQLILCDLFVLIRFKFKLEKKL